MRIPPNTRKRQRRSGAVWYEYRKRLRGKRFTPSFGNDLGSTIQEAWRRWRIAEDQFTKAKSIDVSLPGECIMFTEYAENEWIPRYVATHRGKNSDMLRLMEIRDTRARLTRYVYPYLGGKFVGDITEHDLMRLHEATQASDKSRSWQRKIMGDVRQILDHAVQSGVLSSSPFRKRFTIKDRRGLPRPIFSKNLQTILDTMGEPYHSCIEVAYRTGLRWKEQRNLLQVNVDLEGKQAFINGTKDPLAPDWRVIPIDERVLGIFTRWMQNTPGPYIQPWRPKEPSWPSRCVRRRAGVVFQWKQLRHTFACYYLARGGNMGVLSHLMGHSSGETTRIYARVYSGQVREDFDAVSKAGKVGPEVGPALEVFAFPQGERVAG